MLTLYLGMLIAYSGQYVYELFEVSDKMKSILTYIPSMKYEIETDEIENGLNNKILAT